VAGTVLRTVRRGVFHRPSVAPQAAGGAVDGAAGGGTQRGASATKIGRVWLAECRPAWLGTKDWDRCRPALRVVSWPTAPSWRALAESCGRCLFSWTLSALRCTRVSRIPPAQILFSTSGGSPAGRAQRSASERPGGEHRVLRGRASPAVDRENTGMPIINASCSCRLVSCCQVWKSSPGTSRDAQSLRKHTRVLQGTIRARQGLARHRPDSTCGRPRTRETSITPFSLLRTCFLSVQISERCVSRRKKICINSHVYVVVCSHGIVSPHYRLPEDLL